MRKASRVDNKNEILYYIVTSVHNHLDVSIERDLTA